MCPSLQGVDLTDEELLSYISESSTMSKSIDEYEGMRSRCPARAQVVRRALMGGNCFQHACWSRISLSDVSKDCSGS